MYVYSIRRRCAWPFKLYVVRQRLLQALLSIAQVFLSKARCTQRLHAALCTSPPARQHDMYRGRTWSRSTLCVCVFLFLFVAFAPLFCFTLVPWYVCIQSTSVRRRSECLCAKMGVHQGCMHAHTASVALSSTIPMWHGLRGFDVKLSVPLPTRTPTPLAYPIHRGGNVVFGSTGGHADAFNRQHLH